MEKFQCNRCGRCCRMIGFTNIPELRQMADSTGKCRHLMPNNLCRIYENRPLYCRVDAIYDRRLSNVMSRQQWYEMNYKQCKNFRRS